MVFKTIMGSVVFYLIPTPCKPDEILSIIRIIRIKDGFMRVTIQIFNAALGNLETSNSRFHILVW